VSITIKKILSESFSLYSHYSPPELDTWCLRLSPPVRNRTCRKLRDTPGDTDRRDQTQLMVSRLKARQNTVIFYR